MLDPVSSAVISYLGDKLVGKVEQSVRTNVIERWSRHRAEQFFDAFAQALLDVGLPEAEITNKLDELLADDVRSEIVFDAYRSVCLTKSRDMGPRVIALLTAELVVAGVLATEVEEAIFTAAEQLTDTELAEFCKFIDAQETYAKRLHDGSLEIKWANESMDFHHQASVTSTGPLNLADVGTWAAKLHAIGAISSDIRERIRSSDIDTERHVDMSGTTREITWLITIRPAALGLAKLIRRAGGTIER